MTASPAWSSLLRFGPKLSPELFPGNTFVRMRLVLRKPFIQYFPVPPWNRHLRRMSRDDVPESLHVVDLFLDRKIGEAWWWNRKRSWHWWQF
jgi:hypothetical protein